MNKLDLRTSLRQLADERANDSIDPWLAIRERVERSRRGSRGNYRRLATRWSSAVPTAFAAAVVLALGVSVALFANRPQPASAAEVLARVQAEAVAVTASAAGPCAPPNPGGGTDPSGGGVVAFQSGQPGGAFQSGQPGGATDGPTTVANATELSDKLAQALGVSGDSVRQAMRATLSPELPGVPPPDPVAGIARQLGVGEDQVCAAFFNPQAAPNLAIARTSGDVVSDRNGKVVQNDMVLNINGTVIHVNSMTADQLSGPAAKLGVTPERLLAAVKAVLPTPPTLPPTPPDENQLIKRFAQNLGLSEDRVRAAITQVEGQGNFYFVVPFPGLGKS